MVHYSNTAELGSQNPGVHIKRGRLAGARLAPLSKLMFMYKNVMPMYELHLELTNVITIMSQLFIHTAQVCTSRHKSFIHTARSIGRRILHPNS